jgi:uncharacterized protein (UPF0297 family)
MTSDLGHVYAAGLADEKLVKQYLTSKGLDVKEPTKDEDRFQDIDCHVNGIPSSIKSEQAGAKYGNIYFELAQQLTSHVGCEYTKSVLNTNRLTQQDIDDLVEYKSWEASWYVNGTALVYYIYQGDKLYVYRKQDIQAYVAKNGWLRIKTLSSYRKGYLGDSYRYSNSACGFLNVDDVKHQTYTLLKTVK